MAAGLRIVAILLTTAACVHELLSAA